jgi:hypothetical protein
MSTDKEHCRTRENSGCSVFRRLFAEFDETGRKTVSIIQEKETE